MRVLLECCKLSASQYKPWTGFHIVPKPCHHPQTLMLSLQAVWVLWWHCIKISSYSPHRWSLPDWRCTLPKSIKRYQNLNWFSLIRADKGLCFVNRQKPQAVRYKGSRILKPLYKPGSLFLFLLWLNELVLRFYFTMTWNAKQNPTFKVVPSEGYGPSTGHTQQRH